MIFIITAEIAGGNATMDEVKCAVAKTTPKEEFCMPTCNIEGLVKRTSVLLEP